MLGSAGRVIQHKGLRALMTATFQHGRAMIARDVFGRHFVRRNIYDYQMWLDTRDRGLSRTLLLFGERELEHKRLMEMLVRPSMTIFDIGANIGYYVLMENRLLGGSGKIVAIEPSPQNATLLRRNVALNNASLVTVLEGAVSDKDGERQLFITAESNLNSFHADPDGKQPVAVRTVTTTTVPELARTYGPPDLIRMDVEGHEVEILNAMLPELAAGRMAPTVVFEVHRRRYGPDHDFEKTLRGMFAAGYSVPVVGSSQEEGTERIRAMGYIAGERIRTDFMTRTLFSGISQEDAITLICRTGGVRTVVLARD